ncbi:MAG TPA: phosphoribosyltransferase family protein [Thermoanaerobaculia bacterium]|nr:phosphoribosyltransferase family protein [Thermoanaerobaculia bacterium]
MRLNPSTLSGEWDDGCALDWHLSSSEFIGYNEHGHRQFENTRTELGELLFRLKYRSDHSAVAPIAQAACDFVRSWKSGIDVIVPAPPSRYRAIQPLFQIADELGKLLGLPVDKTSVRKTKGTPELKNNVDYAQRIELVKGAHVLMNRSLRGRRVLLLDDLYQSGATLNALARLLKESGEVSAVFALALTRARS